MIKDINIMAQPFKITAIIFIVISIIIDIKMVLEEIKKKDRHNKRSRMVLVGINFLIFLVSMHFRNLTSEVFAISMVLNTTISGFYSLDLPKHPKEYYYRFLTFFTVMCSISVVTVVGSY